jgi:hypothetical protein
MPMLSYVHHLFNADQCQAYIHTLRWKDRPLQCPRCQSHNVGPWDFLPFVNPRLSIFTPFARPAHNECGLHHNRYDHVAWPSGCAAVGRQYCVKPGHGAAPSPATPHTRC